MMRLTSDRAADVRSPDELPEPVYRFLNEEIFYSIWCDLNGTPALKPPVPCGGYFGVKALNGVFCNKKNGVVNLAFSADAQELQTLALIVNRVLCNYGAFNALVFRMIQIDASGAYSVDKQAFLEAVAALPGGAFPAFVANEQMNYGSEKDLLHYAVCLSSWERATPLLPGKWIKFLRPARIIDQNSFDTQMR